MTKQVIKHINIKDLVLWTENPRDPIDKGTNNQEIAENAVSKGGQRKWKLKKLATLMGKRYDTSELPTVVYDDGIPLVYDGNRRVLIGKIKYNRVTVDHNLDLSNLDFPEEIPCNVCDEQTALEHVDRKHGDNGTWDELERDIFKHYHMKEDKSVFLILEETTGIISNNPFMNKRFVKEEVFSINTLNYLGISIENGFLETPYSDSELKIILKRIVKLVQDKEITTRKNRGKLIPLLEEYTTIKNIISSNKKIQPYNTNKKSLPPKKRTPRIEPEETPLFGEYGFDLKGGMINNLLVDLEEIQSEIDKKKYSRHAKMIISAGLRLLCHVADKKNKRKLSVYIEKHFDEAKAQLNREERTFLRNNGIKKETMTGLLNVGAHGNSNTISKDQNIAMSLIIAKILEKSHGKK